MFCGDGRLVLRPDRRSELVNWVDQAGVLLRGGNDPL
jgi:hypothetical protein